MSMFAQPGSSVNKRKYKVVGCRAWWVAILSDQVRMSRLSVKRKNKSPRAVESV